MAQANPCGPQESHGYISAQVNVFQVLRPLQAQGSCHVTSDQGGVIQRICENECLLSIHPRHYWDNCRRYLPGRPAFSFSTLEGLLSTKQVGPDPTHISPAAPTRSQSPS